MNQPTLLQELNNGVVPDLVTAVAACEQVQPERLAELIIKGRAVIPCHRRNRGTLDVCGIGESLRVKINANLGTSPDCRNLDLELEKARVAVAFGADALMDLSIGGDVLPVLTAIRRAVTVPLGTVPVYTAMAMAKNKYGDPGRITADDLFASVTHHCELGVDFMTVHCGVTRAVLETLKEKKRILNIVSRGGSVMANFMLKHNVENPFYEQFDRLLDIAAQHDVTLSLGDGLRPGCIADATDSPQMQELIVLAGLAVRARRRGVQVMIEGPGHVPLHEIAANIKIQKSLCQGAPFYVLGPLPTDIAVGYDHIAGAIGAALAGLAGADFLCYVTPAEHLRLPTVDDVRQGVIASRIAAHSVNLARGFTDCRDRDRRMAVARRELNWEAQFAVALDPDNARAQRQSSLPADPQLCSMCGEYCAVKNSRDIS